MDNVWLVIIFFMALLPGIAGAFLPVPGLLYMFIISLVYGFIDDFQHLTVGELTILGIVTVVAVANDYLTGALGAKYGGAAQKSMLLGVIGMILGTLILPPFGGLIGVFAGIFISEFFLHGNKERATKAATGGLLGSIAGMLITIFLAVVFLALFLIFGIS